jgi:hypothetical protein
MVSLILITNLCSLSLCSVSSLLCVLGTPSTCCVGYLQVTVALCQLHVTADKEQNIATAKAAIEVSPCSSRLLQTSTTMLPVFLPKHQMHKDAMIQVYCLTGG